MQEHYGFSDEQFAELRKNGVTISHMFKAVSFFDPYGSNANISHVGLMYYADAKGNYETKPIFPHKKIAAMVFENLPIMEKIAVAEYIDLVEHNYIEEAEED